MPNFYKKSVFFCGLLFCLISTPALAQTLKIKDFAVWGGSASAASYSSNQGVFMSAQVSITGAVGSNHQIDGKNNITVTGNVVSGNQVSFSNSTAVSGNIFALKKASNLSGNVFSSGVGTTITGSIMANGKVNIKSGGGNQQSKITGTASVPAPSLSNYSGPTPAGAFSNTLQFPDVPIMPINTPFDGKVGTTDITSSLSLNPGSYRRLALTGSKSLTLSPGNYIFSSVTNSGGSNEIVFDFKGTATGSINIYIINDANWGKISARIINGGAPSRIFTEVHGNGATNGGNSFDLADGSPKNAGASFYNWAGTVWAPNGGINIGATNNSTNGFINVAGALWSGTKVYLSTGVSIAYTATVVEPNFISPFYTPPTGGKVPAAFNDIGSELYSLTQNPAATPSLVDNSIFQIDNGTVMIEVISKQPNDITLKNQLAAVGMTGFIDNGPHTYIISGKIPINQIRTINSFDRIEYVRPLYLPINNVGQVTTQGDVTMRSNSVRERFALDGEGVKIGVLSDSYNTRSDAQHDVDEGDLPGIKSNGTQNENPNPVQVILEYPGPKTDEGRAMLQIVHDVAPKSKLAFRTGCLTEGDFAKAIKTMADPNLAGGRCDIIVDDITYITEPFLQDGVVAKTVDEVVAQGVTYFSAAGNFGEKSYENNFRPVGNATIVPSPATIHKFGTTDGEIYQTLRLKPGVYTIVLQWSDDFHSLGSTQGVQNDLDLYLLSSTGFTLFGFNRSNLFGDPFEVCPFVVTEETEAKLMIVNATGNTGNVRFKYVIFRGDGTIVNYQNSASTVVGHPNANGAISVGAMLYANIPRYTPVYPGVASFSSRGGTGTLTTSNTYVARNKPDLIAPNVVNTTVTGLGPAFDDGDSFSNFTGTSAAAPHAAAVGALLLQAKKKYDLKTSVTPNEIRSLLQNAAGKFPGQTTSHNFVGGYGYLQADSSVQQIANARPVISGWEPVNAGTQPGSLAFAVKVKGLYLTSSSVIYFNGRPLPTTVSVNNTEAIATIPPIALGEDPPLQLFNTAKSASGLDGGLSEALHFFSSRVDVTVRAQNARRKYGQENPVFNADIFINGVPIEQTNVTLAALKLDGSNLAFLTGATATSNAGRSYSIIPARKTPLDPNDPLLAAYGFTFTQGSLNIDKIPLKITPADQTLRYGDYPTTNLNYELGEAVANKTTLLDEVKRLHEKYLADNALIVMHGSKTQSSQLTETDLANTSLLASFQAVRNARAFSFKNGQLTPIVESVSPADIGSQRFLIDVATASLNNYKINPAQSVMIKGLPSSHARALLNIKDLANGSGKAALQNGQLQPIVNGQLLAMVNGQLQAMVNGQLQAVVKGVSVVAEDIIFQNGQLLALVNREWVVATNGQLQTVVNGQQVAINLSVVNGQLQAVVNGQLMALVNGQLQAVVNGQLLAVVNGQLQAVVNGQLLPMVNGQLMAMVNGQLQPVVNGQLLAVVNGQLMAVVNGQLEAVESLTISNGQLQAVVNGQLQAVVNGQLKAMVNGVITDVPNPVLVNGQLQAVVNGQLQAVVNGQLQAIVNGQLQPIVNGDLVPISGLHQLTNGQLRAVVNGIEIPLTNGQLQAMVNGQLLAMVNGQLMAIVNGELTFAVLQNGQLRAVVNGQLQPVVNGQLRAIVNNQVTEPESYTITNGQLQAVVNGQSLQLVNNQLLALANGQLQPIVNNFEVSGTNNNANTMVLVDEDDITLQGGALGGMFAVNMITGLDTGTQKLCPGAFINSNFDVSYGVGTVTIVPRPLVIKANDITKIYGEVNPPLTTTPAGLSYNDALTDIISPAVSTVADATTGAGQYPIVLTGGNAANYTLILQSGMLTIQKKQLTVTADNKTKIIGQEVPPLTISYNGLVNGDSKDDICAPLRPRLPKAIDQLERTSTYTNVQLNDRGNKLFVAPGSTVTLTATWDSKVNEGPLICEGCITQHYIGIAGVFSECHDVSGSVPKSGVINKTFIAPIIPGTYYITQVSSWEFNCFDRGTGLNFDNNNKNNAIAVLVVQNVVAESAINASTIANATSPAGSYPIVLSGCNSPNYNITYNNGTLNVISSESISARQSSVVADSKEDVKDQVEEKLLRSFIAPNPAVSIIKVQLSNDLAGTKQVQVLDQLGRLHQIKNIKQLSARLFEIDIAALPKGVYFIKIKTTGNEEVFRFLKL